MAISAERQPTLKPVDIVVALQLTIAPDSTFSVLATAVGVSHGEAHNSFGRLRASRLTRPDQRAISTQRLVSFITSGVPVAFPAIFGPESRGVPTAHSAVPFRPHVAFDDEPLVWADVDGSTRGTTIIPLFPRAPALSRTNVPLYELLTLVDSIRIDRSTETATAIRLLSERLTPGTGGFEGIGP